VKDELLSTAKGTGAIAEDPDAAIVWAEIARAANSAMATEIVCFRKR